MRPLGPVEAFVPAIDRTRALLFQPFQLWRCLRLAISAYLALCGTFFLPLPLLFGLFPAPLPPGARVALWVVAVCATLLLFALFCLGCRFQFILFDQVVTLRQSVRELWRMRSSGIVWRWIGMKFAFLLPLALLLTAALLPMAIRFAHVLPAMLPPPRSSGTTQPAMDPALMFLFFGAELVLAAAFALLVFASSLLSDLVLPSLALEHATLPAALTRATAFVRSDPKNFAGFICFQTLLAIGGGIAQYAVSTVLTIIVLIPLFLIGAIVYFALHTAMGTVGLVIGAVLFYGILILCSTLFHLIGIGIVVIFLRSYSLLFLAGRYPLLASVLQPLPPPLPRPYPHSTPPPPLI